MRIRSHGSPARVASHAAAMDLLRPAALAPTSLLRLIVSARGMARRPGGDEYSPARGGGGVGDRAPTEMAPLFPGCDYEHWLIVMDKPGGEGASKQQMIDCYVNTLAKVLGRSFKQHNRKSSGYILEKHLMIVAQQVQIIRLMYLPASSHRK